MATNTLNTRILLRSDTTANWEVSTLILLKGEIGLEYLSSGEIKAKAGNGTDVWSDLPYATLTPTEINTLITTLNASAHTHSNKSILDSTTASFTTTLKTKLDGIAESADNVAFTQALTSGTKVGTIIINGSGIDLYAPSAYTHPSSGVTAGTYKSVTVNAQGHVTAGSNPTTLSGYGITDAATQTALDAEVARATAAEDSLSSSKANVASPTFTGTPKAPTAAAGTNTTQIATTAFVQTALSNGIAASDAMIIKGTIGTTGTVTALPTTYKTGWTYRVTTAGTYAGQVCEVGDLIIALVDRAGTGNVDADWCVAQTNINGAITGVKSGDAYLTVSQSGSVITITHTNVTRTDTTSDVSPAHGGSFTAIKSVTSDGKGHVTGVDTETVKLPSYSAGTGLALSGTTINHSNSVTAGTAQGDASKTLTFGGTFLVPSVTYDAQGHIIGKGTTTMTMPATPTTISGNAGSATKLATARGIDGVTFNGTAAITHYAECSTEAATAAKVVTLTGYTLATGSRIAVKFTVTNTAASPTLNVNSTGAKSIMYRGSAISAGYLAAKRVYEFIYDGTNWELVGDINTDTNTKVTNTLATTTKAYVTGTTSATTNTGTQVFDTGVYLDTTAGKLVATTFSGALSGNASSATKLATARTIGLTGGATGTATSFNGTANISIPVTAIDAMYLNVSDADTLILNGGGAS